MNRKEQGQLVCRALAQLSPELFFHPLWVGIHGQADQRLIHDLLEAGRILEKEGDPESACQILLGCAVLEKRGTRWGKAFRCLEQAGQIAQTGNLHRASRWVVWGESALFISQGEFIQASRTLNQLYRQLQADQEWVIAIIVDDLSHSLIRPVDESTDLRVPFEWMTRWGDSPESIQETCLGRETTALADARPAWRLFPSLPRQAILAFFLAVKNMLAAFLDRIAFLRPILRLNRQLRDRQSQAVKSEPPRLPPHMQDPPLRTDPAPSQEENNPVPAIEIPLEASRSKIRLVKPTSLDQNLQASLTIYCLGPFSVYIGEQIIENWTSRKALAVFKYLVTHQQVPVYKDILMDTFWPDSEPEAARRNLHQAVYALRQTLKTAHHDLHVILYENDRYLVNPELPVWLDYEEFERHVQAGRALEGEESLGKALEEYGIAEGLYADDFLMEDVYEDWPQAKRQQLRQVYFSIAQRLANEYLRQQEYAAAITMSRRILEKDNCQEGAYSVLMRSYLAQGQRHLAISQYQLCLKALKTEMDLQPSGELQALYREILEG